MLYDKLVYTCSVLVFVCVKPCRYLAVYDSDNRQKLLDAYDDEVSFYVKYNAALKWTHVWWYIHHNFKYAVRWYTS